VPRTARFNTLSLRPLCTRTLDASGSIIGSVSPVGRPLVTSGTADSPPASPSMGDVDREGRTAAGVTSSRGQRLAVPLVVGVLCGAAVLALRGAGVLDGAWAVAVVAGCFAFAPGPRRFADRFLLAFVLVLGWLPLVGWLPSVGVVVDVPGIALAIATGVVCGYQASGPRRGARTVRIAPSEVAGIGIATIVTLWWQRPFAGLSAARTLHALFAGWDNDSHFAVFRSNLRLGSFVQARPNLPSGASRLGYDYPQGVHQAWAQLVRLVSPHPSAGLPWLLHSYLDMLLLTIGATVAVGCMAVCRLARRDLLVALPAMGLVAALFGLGRLGPFNGFPNYELAIVACAVAVTLMIRPTLGPAANFFAVAGMGLVVVYNWYPLVVMMAPAVVVAALQLWSRSRRRVVAAAIVVATMVAYALPAIVFSHRGVSFINTSGGGVTPPWGLLIITVMALTAAVVVRHVLRPELVTNAIVIAPAVLGGGVLAVIALYEVRSMGTVSYYGQKFGEGVLAVCLVVLACLCASELTASAFRRTLSVPVAVVLSAVLALGLLQVDGYVGPSSTKLQSTYNASALDLHSWFTGGSSLNAQRILLAAQISEGRAGTWWYVDPTPVPSAQHVTDFAQLAQWFLILRGDPTGAGYNRVWTLALRDQLLYPHAPAAVAATVIRDFSDPARGHVHLFVPGWLRRAIIAQDPAFGRPGTLLLLPAPTAA